MHVEVVWFFLLVTDLHSFLHNFFCPRENWQTQGEDTEESVSLTKPRTKTSTTAPEEASLTQKKPAQKKPTVLLIFIFYNYLSL